MLSKLMHPTDNKLSIMFLSRRICVHGLWRHTVLSEETRLIAIRLHPIPVPKIYVISGIVSLYIRREICTRNEIIKSIIDG